MLAGYTGVGAIHQVAYCRGQRGTWNGKGADRGHSGAGRAKVHFLMSVPGGAFEFGPPV